MSLPVSLTARQVKRKTEKILSDLPKDLRDRLPVISGPTTEKAGFQFAGVCRGLLRMKQTGKFHVQWQTIGKQMVEVSAIVNAVAVAQLIGN